MRTAALTPKFQIFVITDLIHAYKKVKAVLLCPYEIFRFEKLSY